MLETMPLRPRLRTLWKLRSACCTKIENEKARHVYKNQEWVT